MASFFNRSVRRFISASENFFGLPFASRPSACAALFMAALCHIRLWDAREIACNLPPGMATYPCKWWTRRELNSQSRSLTTRGLPVSLRAPESVCLSAEVTLSQKFITSAVLFSGRLVAASPAPACPSHASNLPDWEIPLRKYNWMRTCIFADAKPHFLDCETALFEDFGNANGYFSGCEDHFLGF